MPFGSVAALPTVRRGFRPVAVGTKGVRPVIGTMGVSPGVAMEMGVNRERFVPDIMDMLGRVDIPRTHTIGKQVRRQNSCAQICLEIRQTHLSMIFFVYAFTSFNFRISFVLLLKKRHIFTLWTVKFANIYIEYTIIKLYHRKRWGY